MERPESRYGPYKSRKKEHRALKQDQHDSRHIVVLPEFRERQKHKTNLEVQKRGRYGPTIAISLAYQQVGRLQNEKVANHRHVHRSEET